MLPKRRRFNVSDIVNSTFYQVPRFLFTNELKTLNSDARLLYGMLKDRHELSLKNKWLTDSGDVFLIHTPSEMMQLLGVNNKTVIKAVEALKDHGLLEEERQGLRKPNLIFIYMVDDYQIQVANDVTKDGNESKEAIGEVETKIEISEEDIINSLSIGKIPEVENFHIKKWRIYILSILT